MAAATIFPDLKQEEIFVWSVAAITDMANVFTKFAT